MLVGQLNNRRHLLSIFRKNYRFRHVMISRVRNLVMSINLQLLAFVCADLDL